MNFNTPDWSTWACMRISSSWSLELNLNEGVTILWNIRWKPRLSKAVIKRIITHGSNYNHCHSVTGKVTVTFQTLTCCRLWAINWMCQRRGTKHMLIETWLLLRNILLVSNIMIFSLKSSLQNLPVKYNFHVAVQHNAQQYDHKDLKHGQPRRVLGRLTIQVAS